MSYARTSILQKSDFEGSDPSLLVEDSEDCSLEIAVVDEV
jgi:hypothetical protein